MINNYRKNINKAIKNYLIFLCYNLTKHHLILFLFSLGIILSKVIIKDNSLGFVLEKAYSEGLVSFYPLLFNIFAAFKLLVTLSPVFIAFALFIIPFYVLSCIEKFKRNREFFSYLLYNFLTIVLVCETFDFWMRLFFGKEGV